MGVLDQNWSDSNVLNHRIQREQLLYNQRPYPTGLNPAGRGVLPAQPAPSAPTPVMDQVNAAIQPYLNPLSGSPYKSNPLSGAVSGPLELIGNGVADAARAVGNGVSDAAGAAWDGITGIFTKGARAQYEKNRADLNPDASQYVQPPAAAKTAQGVLSGAQGAATMPVQPVLSSVGQAQAGNGVLRGTLTAPATGASRDAAPFPRPTDPVDQGSGFIRNNRTGQVTQIGPRQDAPQAIARPLSGGVASPAPIADSGGGMSPFTASDMVSVPRRDPVRMPVFGAGGGGGLFSTMGQFVADAAGAAQQIQSNRGNNTQARLDMALAGQQDSSRQAQQRIGIEQARTQQGMQQAQQQYALAQQKQEQDARESDARIKHLLLPQRDQFDVTQIKGADSDGNPVVTPVMVNKSRLGPDGQPIVMPIQAQQQASQFGNAADVRQAFRNGRLTEAQAVEALKQFGYK